MRVSLGVKAELIHDIALNDSVPVANSITAIVDMCKNKVNTSVPASLLYQGI